MVLICIMATNVEHFLCGYLTLYILFDEIFVFFLFSNCVINFYCWVLRAFLFVFHSRYKCFVSYVTCKCFLPVCSLFFLLSIEKVFLILMKPVYCLSFLLFRCNNCYCSIFRFINTFFLHRFYSALESIELDFYFGYFDIFSF